MAEVERGDRVIVDEPGIGPWTGVAKYVKPAGDKRTYVEIRRDDGATWSVPARMVRPAGKE